MDTKKLKLKKTPSLASCIFCILQLITFNTFSQEGYSISGHIKDSESGETLLGANVLIKNSEKGVSTNEYGFYSISLPKKKYTLQFSYIGYDILEIEIDLSENKNLDIELKESLGNLEEVVINSRTQYYKSQVKSVFSSVSNLKNTDIKKLPALLGEPDLTRTILTQSGVSSIGEGTSGFNIRGGNIDQNLILLDEAPVYNTSHIWGFFSIFNSDAIKDIKLYKGGIPAQFGGRASSVMYIRQREGNSKEFKGEGGIGLLFSRLTLGGPIKKEKLNFLFSGRRSYFDLFFPLLEGEDFKNSKIYFYDLNTKINWNIDKKNKLFISGYFGADVMKLKFDGDEDSEGDREDENIDFQWKNATATLLWNRIFSDRLFMNTSGIYSRYNYSLSSENDSGGPTNVSGTFDWNSTVENWILKPDFTFYKDSETKIRFGINNTLYLFSPTKITTRDEGINNLDFKTEKGLEIAPYFSYEKKWKKLNFSTGIRYSWFGNIGPHEVAIYKPDLPKSKNTIIETKSYKSGDIIKDYSGFEPRISLNYNLNDFKSIKLGYNRMFQYIHLISNTAAKLPFDIWKPSGLHVPPIEVNQISIGYAHDTYDRIYNFSVASYYKTFKNVIEYKEGADLFLNENLETELLPAKGYSYGLEFSAYKVAGKMTGNLNYTYSVTRRKTTSSFSLENINNGDYYPSNYDRPHIFNLTANYKLSNNWRLGAFFTYQTGRPITLPVGRFSINGLSYINYSDRNAYRISDTHRLDISFTYNKNNPLKKWKGSWTFGVYNIYAHQNAFSVYSKFKNEQLKTFQFSVIGSIIPFVTYNFKF